MSNVLIPLSGTGGVTASVATETIEGHEYQLLKVTNGAPGSTEPIIGRSTTPGSTDMGLVVRNIPSTSLSQLVHVGNPTTAVTVSNPTTAVTLTNPTTAVTITNPSTLMTVSNPTTAMDATLSSLSSTRLIGRVDVNNPTTGVTISNPTTSVTITNPSTLMTMSNPTTAVDLTSAGSTRVVGRIDVNNPTTSVNVANPTTAVTITNPTTSVTVSNPTTSMSLSAGSSANMLGAVAQGPGSTSLAPWYTISSASGGAGSTVVDANLSSLSSTRVIGLTGSIPMTPTRTTANASIDTTALAANANRRAAMIQNGSTAASMLVNLSSGVVTSNAYAFQIPASGFAVIGDWGSVPLYTGNIHIKMNSTALSGPAFITEFV